MTRPWIPGEVITRREMLGLQPDAVSLASPVSGVWLETPVVVVEDSAKQLASYIPTGAKFRFPEGRWPTLDGKHPWSGRSAWEGNGCLMLQHPSDHYSIWHFWDGPQRDFVCWYLNLQTAFVRTPFGYDTQDLELDIIVRPDGSYEIKDAEVLDDRISEGRYTAELVVWIREYGRQIVRRLETHGPWWDQSWASWSPDPAWVDGQGQTPPRSEL